MTAADKQKSELKRKILGFAHLSNGWDGYDGEAPNLSDIGNAVDFLEKIPAHRVLAARPVVVGDGEVGFAWDMGNCYMGIIFVHEDVFSTARLLQENSTRTKSNIQNIRIMS